MTEEKDQEKMKEGNHNLKKKNLTIGKEEEGKKESRPKSVFCFGFEFVCFWCVCECVCVCAVSYTHL